MSFETDSNTTPVQGDLPTSGQTPAAGQVPVESPASAPSESDRSIVSLISGHGFQFDETYSDADLIQDLEQQQKDLEAFQSVQPELEEYRQQKEAFQTWKSSQSATPQVPAASPVAEPPAESEVAFAPPAVDAYARDIVSRGVRDGSVKVNQATGLLETDNAILKASVDQLNAAETYRQKFYADFANDPVEFLNKINKPLLTAQEQQLQELKQRLERYEQAGQQQAVDRFFQQNMPQFVEVDAQGKPVVENGHYRPNALYRAYTAATDQMAAYIPDPLKRHEAALEFAKSVAPAIQPPAVQAAAESPRDKQGRFLRRVQDVAPQAQVNRVPDRSVPDSSTVIADTPLARYDQIEREYRANNR